MLSVAAFASGLGEEAMNFLFGDSADISQVEADDTYPADSYALGGQFYEAEDNAAITLTVNFTNNYGIERAKEVIAEPQTQDMQTGTPFSLQFGISGTFGNPVYVDYDHKSGLRYSIDSTTHVVTLASDIGLSTNTEVEVRYGELVYPYTLHIYYEDQDGQWGNYDEYLCRAASGTSIPTEADKEKADTSK